jgi:ubiquitin conjugation factor E4 B
MVAKPESTKWQTAGLEELKSEAETSGSGSSSRLVEASSEAMESTLKSNSNENMSSAALGLQPENPFTKLALGQSNGSDTSTIHTTSADSGYSKRSRVDSSSLAMSPLPRKSAATLKEETIEEFENRIISNIFRITVEEGGHDASGHKLIYLPGLRQELAASGEPVRLSVGTLDSAILEAASKFPHNKPVLDYLLPAWTRSTRALKSLRGNMKGRDVILKEARRLCMSHCIFAVTMLELFGSVMVWAR